MLGVADALARELTARGLRWCHWKSNAYLEGSLEGRDDLDILVEPAQAQTARAVLSDFGFVSVRSSLHPSGTPGGEHWLGIDRATGAMLAVDLYASLVTGGSLFKNYELPLVGHVLDSARPGPEGVPVPSPGIELMLLVVRKLAEAASMLERVVMRREQTRISGEIAWLSAHPGALREADDELRAWLPVLPRGFVALGVDALADPSRFLLRRRLGRRLAAALRDARRVSPLCAGVARARAVLRFVVNRTVRRWARRGLLEHGATVTVIGPEASGKSTVVAALHEWLSEHLATVRIHAGRPPPTVLTFAPNALLPALRRLLPRHRALAMVTTSKALPTALYAVRCALVAHDRRALIRRAGRAARRGGVVISDRYPSADVGSPDGCQLDGEELRRRGRWLAALGAQVERGIYRRVPPPDAVIRLAAPLELTLARNVTRVKEGGPEPDDWVRNRFESVSRATFGDRPVHEVTTDRAADETVREAKLIVWDALLSKRP